MQAVRQRRRGPPRRRRRCGGGAMTPDGDPVAAGAADLPADLPAGHRRVDESPAAVHIGAVRVGAATDTAYQAQLPAKRASRVAVISAKTTSANAASANP